jgi:LPS-assembly protein
MSHFTPVLSGCTGPHLFQARACTGEVPLWLVRSGAAGRAAGVLRSVAAGALITCWLAATASPAAAETQPASPAPAMPEAAQAGAPPEPVPVSMELRPSGMLVDRLPEDALKQMPTFVWGNRISGHTGVQTVVEGQAELRRHDTVIKADRLQLDHERNDARATGSVTVIRNGNRFEGPELQLNLDTYEGFFSLPRYRLLANEGRGDAERVDFQGENLSIAHNATYTTCQAPPGFLPDWWVGAKRLELDNAEEMGRATGGALYFKGVPILAAPYVSFPISDKRKSGLLPPTINLTNLSGFEVTLPYYWNIAPNLDATLYPTLMTKRGIDLGGEFRYLDPEYNGQVRAAYMPSDTLRGIQRWGTSIQHNHALPPLPLVGATGLRVNLNRVSDDDYWRDFPRATSILTQRLLPNEVVLSGQVGPVGISAGSYTWQTLQDASAPITAPYDRVPQVDLRWGQTDQQLGALGGLDWSLTGQYTRFATPRTPSVTATLADIDGDRWLGIAQISRPWQAPGWFVRPKAQWHLTQYQFSQPLLDGRRSAGRAVPTLSLDSGLVFERETNLLGRDLLQTLEPRAFYVHTPYRDQSGLPNYDSGAKDFNIGAAWSDSVFGGHDRISDIHALTLGVSSRLIDPATGVESARFGIAQRLRFSDQKVTLPGGSPVTDRLSDLLLGTTLNWSPLWSFDGAVQYNPKTQRSQRTTLSARYHPQPYHVLSAAYRLQRAGGLLPASEQVDLGWQWPLANVGWPGQQPNDSKLGPGSWYGVGRINYSVPDSKIVDLVAGLEYDAGCWVGRLVLERLQRSAASASQRVMFQLEFTGFTRIGSNPLQTLRDNVPRYMLLKDEVRTPSRFGRYE